jgi:hypothetical protein
MRFMKSGLSSRRDSPLSRGGPDRSDWIRLGIMGALLGFLLYLAFFQAVPPASPPLGGPPVVMEKVPMPELDPAILALAKDGSREERLVREREVLEHLLRKSLRVVPATARAMGMPEEPVPMAWVRSDPARYRGKYLFYRGTLEDLSAGREGHPIDGYLVHEGRLRTQEGDLVLFAVSLPPRSEIKKGEFVRVEGFFWKLLDAHFPVPVDKAPFLVGPEILPDALAWPPVERLDPAVMAKVRDGIVVNGVLGTTQEERQDVARLLVDSQDEPLWHLASHARHALAQMSPEQIQALPAFAHRDQWRDAEFGRMARGTPLRVMGTFIKARTLEARTNPIGAQFWTEVWIQSRDMGGRIFFVWIPKAVEGWQQNESVLMPAYYFRRHLYRTNDDKEIFAPLFVAPDLQRFAVVAHPAAAFARWALAGTGLLLIGILVWLGRRQTKDMRKFEAELVERRRRRRIATPDPATTRS